MAKFTIAPLLGILSWTRNKMLCQNNQDLTEKFQLVVEHGVKHISAAAAKSLQSCPTMCESRDSSPPGSLVPGILQARTLEWVAISFSNAWKWKVKVKSHSTWFSFYRPHGLQPTRLLCPWDFPGKRVLEWGAIAFSDTISWPHMKCSGFLRRKKTWLLFP